MDSIPKDPYVEALRNFQEALEQRKIVLHDSNEHIPAICSRIRQICTEAVHAYNSQPPAADNLKDPPQFYFANCTHSHIITHSSALSRLFSESANHTVLQVSKRSNVLHYYFVTISRKSVGNRHIKKFPQGLFLTIS